MLQLKTLTLFCVFASLTILPAWAQHQVYLETPNSIPSYCQETNIWCGAATGQMILEGYPGGVEHPFTQTHVWNRIQAHRDDLAVNWATDPDGLRDTLGELGPEGHWVIFSNTDAGALTYAMTYWMTRVRYPTAALVYGFQHWVMIDGFTTDQDPTLTGSVTLQWIEIVDPWDPPCPAATSGGVRQLMTGSNWYTNYWYAAGNIAASKWNGKFVAVVEPPPTPGVARAPRQVEEGTVITASQARERAVGYLRELPLKERPSFARLLRHTALAPLLVSRERKGYYIVPIGYEEGQVSQGAILVNAYNGELQEVALFERPFTYLPESRAVRLALSYLCACSLPPTTTVSARLIFQPSEQTKSRLLPVWEIRAARKLAYVTQDGRIFDKLTPLAPGD